MNTAAEEPVDANKRCEIAVDKKLNAIVDKAINVDKK